MGDALAATADVLEFGYGVLAFLVGIGVLALAPGKRVNQTLAWLLIVDGLGLGGIASNMGTWQSASPNLRAGANAAFGVGWALIVPLYLLFIGHALQGGIARWLRSRAGKATTALTALALLPLIGLVGHPEWGQVVFVVPLIAVGVVGLVAAVQNLRHAAAPQERRQARAYLLAFAVRDVTYVVAYMVSLVGTLVNFGEARFDLWWLIFLQSGWLLFLVLLVYGVLSGQVLDIDRRMRVLVARTFALGFVAILFIVITESVERFLDVTNPFIGIGAAVVLAFTFKPVEHLVERGARRVLPASPVSVEDYKRAVEHALADGKVTAREQRLLDDLKARLR